VRVIANGARKYNVRLMTRKALRRGQVKRIGHCGLNAIARNRSPAPCTRSVCAHSESSPLQP
jgi:hypothetical protein